MNSLEDATEAAQEALALDGDHPLANVVAARLERRSGDAAAARDRLRGLGRRNGTLDAAGYTVLGQAHDRLGEFDDAFEAFAQAKQFTRQELGDESSPWQDKFLDHVYTFRTWYSAEKAADWPAPPTTPDQPEPIFFVGFPRSGTTLFEQMLDSHPNLATTGETQILGRLQLITPSLLRRTGQSPQILDDLDGAEVETLGRWYRAEVARHTGAEATNKRVVDKMPLNIVELGFVRRLFPSAPVIVALRDPRDVILSCFMQNFRVNQAMAHFLSVEGTARLYAAVMELWLHYRSDTGLRAIEYRYEDLVADTEGTARRVFEFLGEPWDENVLQYRKRASERFVSTPSYADVSTPIYTRSIGRWRNYAQQLAPALPILAPFVREFGYAEE
jgi:tetratricopeptide (TPR) repeat protein